MVTASRVIAFDGLDSAIIGTCNTAEGREVIAYDYRKVVECFESMDCSFNKDFEEWWRDMTDSIPAEAIPVFVNLDYTVRDEILPKDQPSDIDPHVELQSHLKYAGLNLNELTSQQETYVLARVGGMNMKASARAAGYSERSVYDVEKSPAVQKAIEYFREQNREEVRFELADAHIICT